MAKKVDCYVNGKTVRLSEKAFEFAKRYYGAVLIEAIKVEAPFEIKEKPLILPPKNISEKIGDPIKIEARVSKEGVGTMKDIPAEISKIAADVKSKRKPPVKSKSTKK